MVEKTIQEMHPYLSNSNIDPRILAMEGNLLPLGQFISTQRGSMFSSNLPQFMCIFGAEHPKVFGGYETQVGKYEFDSTHRDQDVHIIAKIPKYSVTIGPDQILENPTWTIVYIGSKDKKIGYFTVNSHTKLSDGFGYRNNISNLHRLNDGAYVEKDDVFSTSPIHDKNKYMYGTNCNVAYMTIPETNNDAFVVSKSLANKMRYLSMGTIYISIKEDDLPLNLMGDETEFRIFPDIGTGVGENGILCGIRPYNPQSFLSDTTEDSLSRPEQLHDRLYRIDPFSTIVDVEVYMSPTGFKKAKGMHTYQQIVKYQEQLHTYYQRIIDVYKEYSMKGYEISPEFNNLVSRCMFFNSTSNKTKGLKIKLSNRKEPINFIHLKITYATEKNISRGYKITGRDGAKGVVSEIRDDEHMPVDEHGFRADIIQSPQGSFNRMNPSQLYEQYINRSSEIVRQRLETMDIETAYNYLLSYISFINPNYGNLVANKTQDCKEEFITQVLKEGIYLNIIPFQENINENFILELTEKFQIPISPVTYYQPTDGKGNVKKIKTKKNVCIGEKYVMLLCKIPHVRSVGFAHVSQFKSPVKVNDKDLKYQHPTSQTPIRFGEDETRNKTMLEDPKTIARISGLYANSPEAVEKLEFELLNSKNPSAISTVPMSTEEIIKNNNNIRIMKHMMGAVGVDLTKDGE